MGRAGPASRGQPEIDRRIEIMLSPKRVRVVFAGRTIVDTTSARLLRETGHTPVYYFPRDDIEMTALRPSDRTSRCPYKGTASYWTVTAGGREAADAAWSYEEPIDSAAEIRGLVAFYWNRMDSWIEEDEEVFVHPTDPYVRVDARRSTRRVVVRHRDLVLADTRRAVFLVETGHMTRYYVPPEDVRMDLLRPSVTQTRCPYKGSATYWDVVTGDETLTDIAWSYPDPVAECRAIRELVCFHTERLVSTVVE
jgi:uncharacterized protein (DUF427 family)